MSGLDLIFGQSLGCLQVNIFPVYVCVCDSIVNKMREAGCSVPDYMLQMKLPSRSLSI